MTKVVTATFDGRVLRPDEPLDLEPNVRYKVTVEGPQESPANGDAWAVLEQSTGKVEAPNDWSAEHDHYLYGTPKRGQRGE